MSRKLYNSQKKELADECKRLKNLNELDDFSGVAEKMNIWVQISDRRATKKEATKRLRKKPYTLKWYKLSFQVTNLLLKTQFAKTVNALQQPEKVNLELLQLWTMASNNISDTFWTQYRTYSANNNTFSIFKRLAQVYIVLNKVPS